MCGICYSLNRKSRFAAAVVVVVIVVAVVVIVVIVIFILIMTMSIISVFNSLTMTDRMHYRIYRTNLKFKPQANKEKTILLHHCYQNKIKLFLKNFEFIKRILEAIDVNTNHCNLYPFISRAEIGSWYNYVVSLFISHKAL